MLDFSPDLADKEIEAVTDPGTSETIPSLKASVCHLSIPNLSPSSSTSSFAKIQEKKLKPARA